MRHWCFILAGTICLMAGAAVAAPVKPKQVGPGVTWYNDVRPEGPLNYNVLKVDLKNPLVTIEAESGKDRLFTGERVLDAARRESEETNVQVIGGVNADFWASKSKLYTPVGLLVADGMIYSMPHDKKRVFDLTKDRVPFIGRATMKVTLSNGRQSVSVNSINPADGGGDVALYTQPYGKTAPAGKAKRFVLKMEGTEFLPNQNVTVDVQAGNGGEATQLGPGIMVLDISAVKAGQFQLTPGKYTLLAAMPQVNGVVASVTGGGPSLVTNGKAMVATDEASGSDFSKTKHPRTAVGFSQDKKSIFMVTVDGRQPKISIGSSLDDLAKYMVSLGCWQAINLDGGGSTTMVVNDEVVNKPSDFKGPRIVANSLLVVSPKSDGIAKQLTFSGAGLNDGVVIAPAGSSVEVDVAGLDAQGIPVKLDKNAPLTAAGTALKIPFSATGNRLLLKLGDAPGSGQVTVQAGQASGVLPVQSVAVSRIVANPPLLVLDSGEAVSVSVRAFSGDREFELQPEMIHFSAPAGGIAQVSGNKVTGGNSPGRGAVEVSVGTAKVSIPIYVGQAQPVTVESFDGAMPGLKFLKFDRAKTRLTAETSNKKVGAGAGRLDYVMEKGGPSRVSLELNKRMDVPPAKLGIWVYGDGLEGWVRSTLKDASGQEFVADFTNGGDGITWKNEWRYLSIPFSAVTPAKGNPHAAPKFPLIISDVYLAQDQEVLKKTGSVIFDQYQAVYPPR